MKAYGIPRLLDREYPDLADIKYFGMASHVGKYKGKGGQYRANQHSRALRSCRRYWKRKARAENKLELRKYY